MLELSLQSPSKILYLSAKHVLLIDVFFIYFIIYLLIIFQRFAKCYISLERDFIA